MITRSSASSDSDTDSENEGGVVDGESNVDLATFSRAERERAYNVFHYCATMVSAKDSQVLIAVLLRCKHFDYFLYYINRHILKCLGLQTLERRPVRCRTVTVGSDGEKGGSEDIIR